MKKKTELEIMIELHNILLKELVEKRLELDSAHLWEPLKKQDKLCAEMMRIEEKMSLLQNRMNNPRKR